jgi:hypothetical protein
VSFFFFPWAISLSTIRLAFHPVLQSQEKERNNNNILIEFSPVHSLIVPCTIRCLLFPLFTFQSRKVGREYCCPTRLLCRYLLNRTMKQAMRFLSRVRIEVVYLLDCCPIQHNSHFTSRSPTLEISLMATILLSSRCSEWLLAFFYSNVSHTNKDKM